MSHNNPGAKECVKRRKVEEGTSESKEEKGRGRSRSTSSRKSCESSTSASTTTKRRPEVWSSTGKKMVERATEYLEEFHEKNNGLFRSARAFGEKAKYLAEEEWVTACRSLRYLSKKNSETIEEMATSEEFCERCKGGSDYTAALASTQFGWFRWALQEFSSRYIWVVKNGRELKKEEMVKNDEEWEEKLRRLAEEKKEVELERGQLRAALATRGESTVPEVRETREEFPSSPSGRSIPRPFSGP